MFIGEDAAEDPSIKLLFTDPEEETIGAELHLKMNLCLSNSESLFCLAVCP